MKRLKTVLSALMVGLLLIIGLDGIAYAATGQSVILGKVNKANKTTTVERTNAGAPLTLKAQAGSPPLAVTTGQVVANLNADRVDGKHASDLGVRTLGYRSAVNETGVSAINVVAQDVPAGTYLANYDTWLYTAANTQGWCWLAGPAGLAGFAESGGNSSGFFPVNGTGVLQVPATADVTLHCEFTQSTNVSSYDLARINLTRIDTGSGALSARPVVKGAPASPTAG